MTELMAPRKSSASQRSATDNETIRKGRRHQTMLSFAGALRARGLSPVMVHAPLRTVKERQSDQRGKNLSAESRLRGLNVQDFRKTLDQVKNN
jgi:hypothetical protein